MASATLTITPTPTAAFTYTPAIPQPGQPVQFTDQSSGEPAAWDWDFGDGYGSTLQHPAHAFWEAGSYTVTLSAANACGWGAPAGQAIQVGSLPVMFVGNIKMKYRIASPGPPPIYKVQGRVPIFAEGWQPVPGAVVTVQWELPGGQVKVRTATTRPNGSAYFKITSPQAGVYTLTVLEVQADGYQYDPDQNWETSEQITVP